MTLPPNQSPPSPNRDTLLVVDDDPDIREAIQQVVEIEGYRAVTAGDGAEALGQLRSGVSPCLILLDLRMPGMDGRTFRERQRAEPGLAGIPVIVLTGDRDGPQIAASLGAECVLKPIDLDKLLAIVDRFCRVRPG
jgi:CheY-like chemotaxis protein